MLSPPRRPPGGFVPRVCTVWLCAEPPPDAAWTANADIAKEKVLTMSGLGAMQGVSFRDGKVYLYGDVSDAEPRVGVIREYTADYKPTGRVVWLRDRDKPLLRHPTGLTWHAKLGAFLGDTVNRKAVIYRFDWDKAWRDGDLSRAVLDVVKDDAAVNGCRPEFVRLGGKDYLATADYGDVHPEVRLYDPEKMLAAGRTSAPGVTAYRVLCGPLRRWVPCSRPPRAGEPRSRLIGQGAGDGAKPIVDGRGIPTADMARLSAPPFWKGLPATVR